VSNYVFVIDTHKRPLEPVHPGQARRLLSQKKAAVFRRYPFTIILKESRAQQPVRECVLKIDPGSKVTGIAILQGENVLWAAEFTHRGFQIKEKLIQRSRCRRRRRNRKTRYRQARFLNRAYSKGKLAPSLAHRVLTVMTWVKKLVRYCFITSIVQELVRFDTQALQNPEIAGAEYQHGELFGYEIREYLLEKWGLKCAYCQKGNTRLEIEHIQPKSKAGSDRVSNLTIACYQCNQKKGDRPVEDFIKRKADILNRIKSQAKAPLKDAAAVNITRWELYGALKETGLHVSVGTGGRTKWNRVRLGLPKTHWLDAACAGLVDKLNVLTSKPLLIKARGRGGRQKAALNKYGYPVRHNPLRPIQGWLTGDVVSFQGKTGRLTTRSNGRFYITLPDKEQLNLKPGDVQLLKPVHRKDGYQYG
jgi:5-methylcytosine-specific restriction endonuclease McrA